MNEKNYEKSNKQPKTPSVPNRAHTEMKKQDAEKANHATNNAQKKENKYE